MLRSLGVLLAAGGALAASAGTAFPQSTTSDALVSVGTHRLEMHAEGNGSPVIVLETGLGETLERLRPLQERLAATTRVVAYNRAGYGRSEPGPMPRDAGREADELAALLAAAEVSGPYVLVGHSLGALVLQDFAARHREAVAGMILLDPPPRGFIEGKQFPELATLAEKMTAEWQAKAEAGAASADAGERERAIFFRTIASEHREMFGASARQAAAIHDFGDLPLVVIASGRPNPFFGDAAESFQRFWVEQSRELSERSTRGKLLVAEGASHILYLDAPDLVVESILDVVRAARGARPGT